MGADRGASRNGRLGQRSRRDVALCPDRIDGLGAARGDAADDVVGVGADRAGHRERSLGELRGDAVSVLLDRIDRLGAARGDAADDVVGMGADRAGHRRARPASCAATPSPCPRIASTASALLAAMRPTTSSAWAPTAPEIANEVSPVAPRRRLRVPGSHRRPGAARGDAADDVVGMGADGVARIVGGLGQASGDPAAMDRASRRRPRRCWRGCGRQRRRRARRWRRTSHAMLPPAGPRPSRCVRDRLHGPRAALVDPADDVVGMRADGAARRDRRPPRGASRPGRRATPIASTMDVLRSVDARDQVVAPRVHVGKQGVAPPP